MKENRLAWEWARLALVQGGRREVGTMQSYEIALVAIALLVSAPVLFLYVKAILWTGRDARRRGLRRRDQYNRWQAHPRQLR